MAIDLIKQTERAIPLVYKEANAQAKIFKALGDPIRLQILSFLGRYEGEVCVFEMVESFPREQPTISRSLRILEEAGLVECRKQGLYAYYYLRREGMRVAQGYIDALAGEG